MKYNFFLIAAMLLLSVPARAQKENCRDMDYYVNKTLIAIQTLDTNAYIDLGYGCIDTMVTVLEKKAKRDTTAVLLYKRLTNDTNLWKMVFRFAFSDLTRKMKKELGTTKWDIKLRSYKITRSKTDSLDTTTDYDLDVKINVNNAPYLISMNVVKYKDCFYVFEPVNHFFFKD